MLPCIILALSTIYPRNALKYLLRPCEKDNIVRAVRLAGSQQAGFCSDLLSNNIEIARRGVEIYSVTKPNIAVVLQVLFHGSGINS